MLTFGVDPAHDPEGDLLGTAELAEGLGYDLVWVGDHLLWYVPSPDPAVMLGARGAGLAHALATGVYLAALRGRGGRQDGRDARSPHGGRFVFGMGIGGGEPAEFAAAGCHSTNGQGGSMRRSSLPAALAG
jgi:alkanesulfonate monooxygenase SsuD/methylene tetrahydromethanopterin reductase-like flavin-dependent oxidoreductase (luciferase family)